MDCDTDRFWDPGAHLPQRPLAAGSWLVAACIALLGGGCGSVGPKNEDSGASGTGGATTLPDASADLAPGTGGAPGAGGTTVVDAAGTGGAGGATAPDAATDQARSDATTDTTAPLPASCLQIKQQNPAAVTGVFTIAPLGVAQSVFCEMTVDNGGWTAFFVGDNGTPPGGAHFESAADSCPDPANRCIRRLPTTIDITRDFAVKCGASVVKFKIAALSLDYWKNGLQHQWQPLTAATTIDVGVVGKADLVKFLWTGEPNNLGWIVAGDNNAPPTTFANGYTTNGSWNYCNGSTQPDSTSRVMLFYR